MCPTNRPRAPSWGARRLTSVHPGAWGMRGYFEPFCPAWVGAGWAEQGLCGGDRIALSHAAPDDKRMRSLKASTAATRWRAERLAEPRDSTCHALARARELFTIVRKSRLPAKLGGRRRFAGPWGPGNARQQTTRRGDASGAQAAAHLHALGITPCRGNSLAGAPLETHSLERLCAEKKPKRQNVLSQGRHVQRATHRFKLDLRIS